VKNRRSFFGVIAAAFGAAAVEPEPRLIQGEALTGIQGINLHERVPPVTHNYNITIHAMDSKDIAAHGKEIADALHAHLQSGNHPIIGTLKNQMDVARRE